MITQTFTYRCSVCPRSASESHNVVDGRPIAGPSVPKRWHKLDDRLICDNHRTQLGEYLSKTT